MNWRISLSCTKKKKKTNQKKCENEICTFIETTNDRASNVRFSKQSFTKRIPIRIFFCHFGRVKVSLAVLKNRFVLLRFILFLPTFFQTKTWIYELSLSPILMHDLQMLNVLFILKSVCVFFSLHKKKIVTVFQMKKKKHQISIKVNSFAGATIKSKHSNGTFHFETNEKLE